MKNNKNLRNELNEMKFLFGYKPGKVISEQNIPEMDDVMFAEPDVMEPEVKPDTDRGVEERPSRPGRPDRDPSRLPYTDPDTHPQGRRRPSMDNDEIEYELEIDDEPRGEVEYELEIDDEPRGEVEYELEIDDEPRRPMRSMGRRSSMSDEVNEPFVDDVDSEYENSDLADLVKKYLSKRG
jgi:hypothetical protein